MILQAIMCDICGTEKKQTNHWFIAYESSGELRIAAWNSPRLLCPGTKHLCGQTCLHKLINQFLPELANKPHGLMAVHSANRAPAEITPSAQAAFDGAVRSAGQLSSSLSSPRSLEQQPGLPVQ